MDEEANTGNDVEHHQRQAVQSQGEVDAQVSGLQPLPEVLGIRAAFRLRLQEGDGTRDGHQECSADRANTDDGGRRICQFPTGESQGCETQQGEDKREVEVIQHQPFISDAASTSSEPNLR